jgi:hypothetical protein
MDLMSSVSYRLLDTGDATHDSRTHSHRPGLVVIGYREFAATSLSPMAESESAGFIMSQPADEIKQRTNGLAVWI